MTNSKPVLETASHSSLSIEKYQHLVNRCAQLRLNYRIANGSALHARIIIDKLFETARSDVVIVSGGLTEVNDKGIEIYAHKPLLENAKRFLRRGSTSLRVVAQSGKLKNDIANVFLKSIVDDEERLGSIKVYLPKVGALSEADTPHFMACDKLAYRFETGEDAQPQNEKIAAIANFGDESSASNLADFFDDIVKYMHINSNLRKVLEFPAGCKLADVVTAPVN